MSLPSPQYGDTPSYPIRSLLASGFDTNPESLAFKLENGVLKDNNATRDLDKDLKSVQKLFLSSELKGDEGDKLKDSVRMMEMSEREITGILNYLYNMTGDNTDEMPDESAEWQDQVGELQSNVEDYVVARREALDRMYGEVVDKGIAEVESLEREALSLVSALPSSVVSNEKRLVKELVEEARRASQDAKLELGKGSVPLLNHHVEVMEARTRFIRQELSKLRSQMPKGN